MVVFWDLMYEYPVGRGGRGDSVWSSAGTTGAELSSFYPLPYFNSSLNSSTDRYGGVEEFLPVVSPPTVVKEFHSYYIL